MAKCSGGRFLRWARQKFAGIPCVFQDFLTQPAAALAAKLCSEPAGTASEHRSYQQQGMGIKKYRSAPPEDRPRPANWYRHTPVARAVADAEQHRSPYFAGGLRARATSQPHATLRAYSYSTNPIWLYPLQMRRQKRPPPRRGPRRHRWGVFRQETAPAPASTAPRRWPSSCRW